MFTALVNLLFPVGGKVSSLKTCTSRNGCSKRFAAIFCTYKDSYAEIHYSQCSPCVISLSLIIHKCTLVAAVQLDFYVIVKNWCNGPSQGIPLILSLNCQYQLFECAVSLIK